VLQLEVTLSLLKRPTFRQSTLNTFCDTGIKSVIHITRHANGKVVIF